VDAEQIVRALAREDAPIDQGDALSYPRCLFCEADGGLYNPDKPMFREDVASAHKPDCPWRLAREWADQHPAA
jgi:hypothetical protein